jgi:hypothetical protein
MSFVLAAPLAQVTGVEIYLQVAASSAALPSWWQFKNSGVCRQTSITLTAALPPGP